MLHLGSHCVLEMAADCAVRTLLTVVIVTRSDQRSQTCADNSAANLCLASPFQKFHPEMRPKIQDPEPGTLELHHEVHCIATKVRPVGAWATIRLSVIVRQYPSITC